MIQHLFDALTQPLPPAYASGMISLSLIETVSIKQSAASNLRAAIKRLKTENHLTIDLTVMYVHKILEAVTKLQFQPLVNDQLKLTLQVLLASPLSAPPQFMCIETY